MEKLRAENFDFALTEYYDTCSLGIFELIGIKKFAAFSPFPLMFFMTEAFAVPSMTSFVPDLSTASSPEMSFSTRMRNFGSPLLVGTVNDYSLFGYTEQVIQQEVNPNFNAMVSFLNRSF